MSTPEAFLHRRAKRPVQTHLKDEEESAGANQFSVKHSCDEGSASVPKGCLPNILIALQQTRRWRLHNDWLSIYVLIYARGGAR